jgi:autotransporter-associated beta strand protein
VVNSGSNITLTSGQAFSSFTSATVEGELTLNGGFILGAMAGAGTVNLAQGTHRLNFLNTWAVTGQLNILSTGTVEIYNSAFGSPKTIRNLKVDGTVDLRSQSIIIGSLTGNGNIKSTTSSGLSQLTVGAHDQSSIYAGTITEPADTISLVKTGSGTFTLTGANKYTGRTNVSAGTLEIGGNGSLSADQSGSGTYNQDITVLAGATFRYSSAFAQTLTYIEGAGSLDLAPTTTINIGLIGVTGNVNVLTGNVLVGGFGIQGSQTRHPTLGWLFNWSGNLRINASSVLQLSQADYSSNPLWTQQLSGILSGTGSLLKMNAKQTLLLTGENTYTGNISVDAGTLRIGGTGYIGSGNYTGSISLAADTQLDFSSSAEQTISGSITGAGTVSVSAGRLSLTGANSYTGDTSISGGTLLVNSGGAIGSNLSTGAVTLSGGALVATSTTTISNRITLAQDNSGMAASSGHTAKFSGIISGLGSVVVGDTVNNGTVVFASANTYSGGTTIDAGSLRADSASAFGSGSILVAAGATLDLHGHSIEDAGVLTLNGAGLNGAGALTNSGLTESTYSNDIVLGSTTAIGSSTAGIRLTGMVSDTDGFGLAFVGTQSITLNNTTNALSLIASGSSLGALSVINAGALQIGSINLAGTTYNGLSSTDRISIKTLTGSLFISQSVSTSSNSAAASAPALLLAAGSNTLPSNTTDNIVLSDSPIFSVGNGGMADFYSGASAGSLGLDASVATKTPNSTVYGYTISYQPSAPGYNIVYRTQSNNTSVSSTTDTDIATSQNRTSSMASTSQSWDSLSANNGAVNPTSGTETKSASQTSDAAPFRSACVLQAQVLSPDEMLKAIFVALDHNLSCRIVGSGRAGGYLN